MGVEDCITRWINLTQQISNTEDLLEKRLEEEKLTLKEFYVLYFLDKSENKRMRLQNLEQLVGLSQSAMSRMIVRMEQSSCCEYIKRTRCKKDGRGVCITLTEKGSVKLQQVLPKVYDLLQNTLY
ncbi:winged helix DNA-binding protein [Gemella sp. GH3]|uniref:MarR family winged helix-turn-helix transcriptional regulator n=1 Tax=unclassified Gemella TaxID=2624949 RepID=UPI0015D023B8|nr:MULTISPECIES: MarR family transcriptional regulator [unclassified Gemella]MBF0714646.1 winged helix DNA-binding protein [Gemella sp. GH3.1]NYS51598.1 winged helix DNA-binding protein [Gemella sp. GH3]